MKCNLAGLLTNVAWDLEFRHKGQFEGGRAFALRELLQNLRELEVRTSQGDMTALKEFFEIYTFTTELTSDE